MKIFISADMEGISGIVASDEVSSAHRDYAEFRKTMTLEVNAAIEGALEAGATEILVNDSHGGGRNILPELLNPEAILSRGQPLPSMIAPLDHSFTAAMLVGYHAMRGTECAIMDHTYRSIYNWIKINGREFGELGVAAAYAGFFHVPIAFVSGDDKLVAEAQAFVPEAAAVVTKYATGRHSADCLSPQKVREAIRSTVHDALTHLERMKPFEVKWPIVLEAEFASAASVDQAICFPDVERTGGRSIRRTFEKLPEVVRFMSVMTRVTG